MPSIYSISVKNISEKNQIAYLFADPSDLVDSGKNTGIEITCSETPYAGLSVMLKLGKEVNGIRFVSEKEIESIPLVRFEGNYRFAHTDIHRHPFQKSLNQIDYDFYDKSGACRIFITKNSVWELPVEPGNSIVLLLSVK